MRPAEPAPPTTADRPRVPRPALFLDRDGTLTEPRHYPSHPDDLVLQRDIGPPLHVLQRAGFALVVVTNQSGLARGLFDSTTLEAMHHRLRGLLRRQGVSLDGIYTCPHHPQAVIPRYRGTCPCRKPAPGMLHRAAHDLNLDLARSWTIGDSACDISAGHQAGTHTALAASRPVGDIPPDVQAESTAEVLCQLQQHLLAHRGPTRPRPEHGCGDCLRECLRQQ